MHKPIPSSFKVDIFEAFDMDLGTMRPGPSYWRGAIRQVAARGYPKTVARTAQCRTREEAEAEAQRLLAQYTESPE